MLRAVKYFTPLVALIALFLLSTAASGAAGLFHVETALGNDSIQETQYKVRLYNDSSQSQSGLKVRVFVNVSELIAAGLSATDVATEKFWDQCNTVTITPLSAWDAAQAIYYVDLNFGSYSLPASSACELHFRIRTAGWQLVWNSANDYSRQGLTCCGPYITTSRLPVYSKAAWYTAASRKRL